MIGGQDVNGAGSLLADADDTAGGLFGGLGIRWDVDKDDVGAVLLQVQAGGGDLHRRDENLHMVLGSLKAATAASQRRSIKRIERGCKLRDLLLVRKRKG